MQLKQGHLHLSCFAKPFLTNPALKSSPLRIIASQKGLNALKRPWLHREDFRELPICSMDLLFERLYITTCPGLEVL